MLDLNNADYEIMPEGEIQFTEPDSEQPVFYMAKSYALDSEGDICDSLHTSLSSAGELVLTVAPEWLAEAVYPVIIDPSIYLPNAHFERSSSAYRQDGTIVPNNTPRYEEGRFGQGITIEEGTTQLFAESRSLNFTSSWTSDTLNGTYTVSIKEGTGKLTLSRGATGTVTVGNSLTFTVSNDKVTFTPSGGTPRKCQLEKKGYATQWHQGGGSGIRKPESMSLPAMDLFNKGNWTVELVFITDDDRDVSTQGGTLWKAGGYVLGIDPSGYIYGSVINGENTYSIVSDIKPAFDSTYSIMFAGDGTNIWLGINGEQIESHTPYVEPTNSISIMYIGASGVSRQCNGIIDDLRISTRARTIEEHQGAYYSNQPLPVDGATSCKMGMDGNLQITAYSATSGGGVSTVPLTATFARRGVAYDQDGSVVNEDHPRFEDGEFRRGILIEEKTENYFSQTQSDASHISGFSLNKYNSGNMSLDTTEHKLGSSCLKWVGANADSFRGIRTKGTIDIENGQTITYSVYLKGSGTCRIGVSLDDGEWKAQSNTINLTDEWRRYSVTYHGAGDTCMEVVQYDVSNPATIYMDCFQAENKPFMTSWHKGGSTRAGELLTLPAACITEDNWTVEMVYIPRYAQTTGPKNKVLWYARAGSDDDYMIIGTNNSGYLYATVCRSLTKPPKPPAPSFILYSITSELVPTVGSSCSIMFAGDGTSLRLCINGEQIGNDIYYDQTRPYNGDIYIGSSNEGTNQCNGIIDDLRISNRARTLEEHQTAYISNQPLPIDDNTIAKFNFDGSVDNSNFYTTDIYGTGRLPYWNYTSAYLGGGWDSSVNTFNLNLLLNKTMFALPGRGVPLQETITYNSLDGRSGPLGTGWHLNSDISLLETIDGSVVYNGGDGSAFTFIHHSDGSYTAPPGIYLTLVKESTGKFTITDKNQTVYTFITNRLSEIVDRNENTTRFTYTDKGNPATITDASTRTLTYTYDNSGRVIEATNPDQQSYKFTYENNYLATVTDPDNKIFTLTYDAKGHLNTFTDPLNRTTTFNIDTNGQIIHINDARSDGEDIYQTSFAQTDDDTHLVTTVTDPLEHVYTYSHDPRTGNLNNFEDPVEDTWEYVWSNNNLISVTDDKGTTSYIYDSKGNILNKTLTGSSVNINETMTYDEFNQILTYKDGENRRSYYHYDDKGNLLATSNPDVKESNGRKYDQYGNVIEYSPRISGRANLISNGSFERIGVEGNLLADWTQQQAGTVSLEGFNAHGNSALKISSSEPTNVLFSQPVTGGGWNRLTLRADIKLDNVQNQGEIGGAVISVYDHARSDTWYVWGNGTFPLVLTSSNVLTSDINVHIGLINATGTVWFDGIQVEKLDQEPALSAFNSVENSSFENGLTHWDTSGYITIESNYAWDEKKSVRIYRNDSYSDESTVWQDIATYGGEPLTLSGMVKANAAENSEGAFFRLEYYDSAGQIIPGSTVETGYAKKTDEFTRLSSLATAPLDAHHARVAAVLKGRGTAYFDSIKLIPRNTETYTYNSAGNYIINSEDPMGYSSQFSYNNNTGTLSSFTDPIGNTTGYYYDNLNRLQQVQDPLINHSYYGYDAVSNLINSRDPRSSSSSDATYLTAFDPNEINQLSILTDPLNKAIIHTYDRTGNLISLMQPNGMEITYGYNDANYLEQKDLDNGNYFTYTYDGAKNLIEVTDQDSNHYSWDYDGAGRVKYSVDALGQRYDYSWDRSHNLTAITEGEDSNVSYVYGKTNRLASLTAPTGTINYRYDESGRVYQIKSSASSYKNITYHPNGWCHNIQDVGYPQMYPFNYQYYNNGNISGILSWAGEENYTYDSNGRLASWVYTPFGGSPLQENYQYDAAGNLTIKGSSYYTYDQANRITNPGYEYDDNGNLTSDGTYDYAYNAENQLIEVRRSSDNVLIATYTYYYNGLRKSKTVNGVTTYFHWDAFGNLVQENDTQNNSIAYYYDPSGIPVGFIRNGDANQKYIYHTNLRGDIVSITDGTDTIQAQYSYDPWGTPTSYMGTMTQPLRYAGYYLDEETGLYYLKSRYYSPEIGRFITEDGYGYIKYSNPQTLNLYAYCNNNPVNFTDPSGNRYVGEAEVYGITVDKNEYDYLSNLANGDDAGNAAWANAILDQYDSVTYNPFSPSDVMSSTGQSIVTSCKDPVTIPAVKNTAMTVLICSPSAGEAAFLYGGQKLETLVGAGQTITDYATSDTYGNISNAVSPSSNKSIIEFMKLRKLP